MVESTLAMLAILLLFLALFGLSDQIRAKLLVENASVKCARARAVGYNDFMLRKIARLATMPAAGKCLTSAEDGDREDGPLPLSSRSGRIGSYLMSDCESQANVILDFEHWGPYTAVSASNGSTPDATATVVQHRPAPFWFGALTGHRREDGDRASISASASTEAHYPGYLQ